MNRNSIKRTLAGFDPLPLGLNPTPIHKLSHYQKRYALGDVYIKRDDLNGIGPGGNKIRNLEFLVSDALRKGCNHMIASGKKESNLCTLAAAVCNKLGIACTLVHNSVEPAEKNGNVLLNKILGIEQLFLGEVSVDARDSFVESFSQSLLEKGKKPYIIYNGATSSMGALGYVAGLLEIDEQNADQNLNITDIFVPGGNGGLASGVVFAAACLDCRYQIHVISVEHDEVELTTIMKQLFKELMTLTGLQPTHAFEDVCRIVGIYRGEGWSIPTQEADAMIATLASLEGIFLERVYTAKTFYGMHALLTEKKIDPAGAVCFVHSGGFSSLFSQFTA